MAAHGVAVQDLGGEAAQVFLEVASEVVDMPFGVAEEDQLFQEYGLSADTVCLFKKVRRWQWGGRGSLALLQPSLAPTLAVR